jgi:hypothetical protein
LHKFHKWPSEFAALPDRERILVMAMIDERIRLEKEESKAMRSKSRKR